jgi:hypothetical protein
MSPCARLDDLAGSAFEHALPWTEEEFFALGETAARVELFGPARLLRFTGPIALELDPATLC